MTLPNVFSFATKELSQDAMICWLISWCAYHDDADLRHLGQCFVRSLFNKHGKRGTNVNLDENAITVEVHQQEKSIDVLARINNKHVLLIEDKTVSVVHDNQLSKYREAVLNGNTKYGNVAETELFPIYFKTGNHTFAERCAIENDTRVNYEVYDRSDFLKVLKTYRGRNEIVLDFRKHLQSLEDRTLSFMHWGNDTCKNDWESWKGFYRELEEKLAERQSQPYLWMHRSWPGWGSHNTLRELMVFWWRPRELQNEANQLAYLQLQRDELYFMINAENCSKERRQSLKHEWREKILPIDSKLCAPKRSTASKNIKIARFKETYLQFDGSGVLDIEATINEMKTAERILIDATQVK